MTDKDHHSEEPQTVEVKRSLVSSASLRHPKINHYLNFPKALMCSTGFLGLYTAIYSAQNIQSVLFEKDGYGALGFYANAVAYLG